MPIEARAASPLAPLSVVMSLGGGISQLRAATIGVASASANRAPIPRPRQGRHRAPAANAYCRLTPVPKVQERRALSDVRYCAASRGHRMRPAKNTCRPTGNRARNWRWLVGSPAPVSRSKVVATPSCQLPARSGGGDRLLGVLALVGAGGAPGPFVGPLAPGGAATGLEGAVAVGGAVWLASLDAPASLSLRACRNSTTLRQACRRAIRSAGSTARARRTSTVLPPGGRV